MNAQKKLSSLFWGVTAVVVLSWTACSPPSFNAVEQPEEVEPNSAFGVDVTVYSSGYAEQADQVISRIGVTLPVSFKEMADVRGTTPYRLIFGMKIPEGWDVTDNIAFTGDDEGYFVYSDSLSDLMMIYYPPEGNYYWWVSEASETHDTDYGFIFFSPVINNDGQHGNFFLDYSLGYWDYNYLNLGVSWSGPHFITCGLQDTVYVTSTGNGGPGTLRAAIDSVAQGGTILFSLATPATIYLNQELALYKSVSIVGPESGNLWISGSNACRIFNISPNREVHLSSLNLVNGSGNGIYAGNGSHGTMENLTISGCISGGGINFYYTGNWELQQVTIESNTSQGSGGGIYAYNSNLVTLTDVIIRGNQAVNGGGIYCNYGSMNLSGVTIMNNHATVSGGGIYGTGYVAFDPDNLCSVYFNKGTMGRDLLGGNNANIYLDKFTVIQPNDYFAYPLAGFQGIYMLEHMLEQIDQDAYVSPSGSDNNSGTSPSHPFKTISQALAMTISDPNDPNTIHLAAGTYSPETNDEFYPIYPTGHIILSGQGPASTLLKSGGSLLIASSDDHVQFNGLNLEYKSVINLNGSVVSFSDFNIEKSGSSYSYLFSGSGTNLSMFDGVIINNIISGSSYALFRATNSSEITLENVKIRDNSVRVLLLDNSSASMTDCIIENNTTSSSYSLISCSGGSSLEMSGTSLRNNNTPAALELAGTTTAWFDPDNRCNIYDNSTVQEILAGNLTGTEISLALDTFSVLHPTDYYVFPASHFNFDILYGKNPQFSQDLYVSPEGSDENTGLTPEDPLYTITRACKLYYPEPDARDTIHLDSGYYNLSSTGMERAPLYLAEGLTLKGAGNQQTFIHSGASQLPAILIQGHHGVSLANLSIYNCTGTGIDLSDSELMLLRCHIISNARGINISGISQVTGDTLSLINSNGTGIYVNGGDVSLENLYLLDNTEGLYIIDASAYLRNLVLGNNSSRGLYARNSQLTLRNSAITGNAGGTGLFLENSGGLLINNIISENISYGYGGGAYVRLSSGKTLTLIDNIIENNRAGDGGGIYYDGNDETNQALTLCGNLIRNNLASSNGGGLYITHGTPFILDCRIEQNTAMTGGGICFSGMDDEVPYLSNSSIHKNLADNGGGIAFESSSGFDIEWSETSRCNIYMNLANEQGQDLYCGQQDYIYPVVVDTFSLLVPTDVFACRKINYAFDILHGFAEVGDFDFYISPDGNDLNTGLSPEEPLKTINYAIWRSVFDTVPPQRIFLAGGIYSASATGEEFPVELRRTLEMTGQGPNLTVIDGEFANQLFMKRDGDRDILRGLTLTGGYNPNNGGAVYSTGGALVLENLVLDTNRAYFGGAIYANGTNILMDNVVMTRNKGISQGGAIHHNHAELSMNSCFLTGNRSQRGGAIYLNNCNAYWDDVDIAENFASYGGGLYISGNFGNQARNTRFEENFSSGSGGAIYVNGTAVVRDLHIINNISKYGAGINISRSDATLMNLCVSGNRPATINGQYSGIYCSNSNVTFDHLSATGNGTTSGRFAFNFISTGTGVNYQATIRNSNIWGNDDPRIQVKKTNLTIEYTNMEHGQDSIIIINGSVTWGEGNIQSDPLFVMTGEHPYQLSPGSPCIDAAQPPIPGHKQYPFDLLGQERNTDGDGDGWRVEDMGAYEFQGLRTPTEEFKVQGSRFKVGVYPNPACRRAVILFELDRNVGVKAELFNSMGNLMGSLYDGHMVQGQQSLEFNVSGLAAGIYLIRVQAGNEASTVRCIVSP